MVHCSVVANGRCFFGGRRGNLENAQFENLQGCDSVKRHKIVPRICMRQVHYSLGLEKPDAVKRCKKYRHENKQKLEYWSVRYPQILVIVFSLLVFFLYQLYPEKHPMYAPANPASSAVCDAGDSNKSMFFGLVEMHSSWDSGTTIINDHQRSSTIINDHQRQEVKMLGVILPLFGRLKDVKSME